MILTQKSDFFGAAASTLCLIHCLITPFIFVAQTCSRTCCSDAPIWWRMIDVVFFSSLVRFAYELAAGSVPFLQCIIL
ncbi:MAG: MerC domain-containing protein [Aureispira sp.]